MLLSERDAVILNLIRHNHNVTVASICTQCNCSPATARRDLSRLEKRGLLRRFHGGAVGSDTPTQSSVIPNARSMREASGALIDRVDVLIITPSRTAAMRLLLERAWRIGVPIIAESLPTPRARTVVSVDNHRAGQRIGRWVGHYAQENLGGKVVVLDIGSDFPNTEARSRGFTDGLRGSLLNGLTLHRVNGQGLREVARQTAADALAVYPDINVIFGINDDSALGGLDAYREAGLDERRLLIVPFGLEGDVTTDLLARPGRAKLVLLCFLNWWAAPVSKLQSAPTTIVH